MSKKQGHHKRGSKQQSPKRRHALRREAEKNDVKAKPTNCKDQTVSELFKVGG